MTRWILYDWRCVENRLVDDNLVHPESGKEWRHKEGLDGGVDMDGEHDVSDRSAECNRTKERIFVLKNGYLLVDALTQALFFRCDHRKIDSISGCRALGLVQVDAFNVGRARKSTHLKELTKFRRQACHPGWVI